MITISTLTKLEWNSQINMDVVELDTAKNVLFKRMIPSRPELFRPKLQPFVSPAGIASTIVRGDNTVMSMAVLANPTPKVISLPKPPKSLSLCSDGGLWVLHSEELAHYNAMGTKIHSIENILAHNLIGVIENNVWLLGYQNQVWFVDSTAQVKGPLYMDYNG